MVKKRSKKISFNSPFKEPLQHLTFIVGDGKPVKIVLGAEIQEDSRKQVLTDISPEIYLIIVNLKR